jgi:hypothetical protein
VSAAAVIAAWERWAAHFPNEFRAQTDKEATLRLASYIELLQDIPDVIMGAAALQVLALYDWFPTVHQVRECAALIVQPSKRSAPEAWAVVQRTIARDGARACFNDPIIAATVEVIGLDRLRFDNGNPATYAQFRDAYNTLLARQRESLITPAKVHHILHDAAQHARLKGAHDDHPRRAIGTHDEETT